MLRFFKWLPQISPAIVYLAIAGFIASRMAVNVFPAEALSWRMFMYLSPIGREASILLPMATLEAKMLWVVVLTCLAMGSLWLTFTTKWIRLRFASYHAAFVLLVYAMSDEKVFIASSQWDIAAFEASRFINISALGLDFMILVAGTMIACVTTHVPMLKRVFTK